jgi:CRP/FNR family cyclic AMP-dependent transcriptional regulator
MASLSKPDKHRLLAASPLFASLSEAHFDGLASVARTRNVAKREELFHRGDEGTQIYVIATGKLKVLTTSLEGDDVVFNITGPGEMIGEVALFSGRPRTATVTAIEPSTLLVLDRGDFLGCLRQEPEVAIKLLGVLGEHIGRMSELIEDTLFLNLPVRLAKKLLRFSRTDGEQTAEGLRINLKLSQEEWGDLVGTTRESVNKQLRAWTEDGVLRLDAGYVVILQPNVLETLAACSLL